VPDKINIEEEKEIFVPIHQKILLSVEEAAAYSGIGINSIRSAIKAKSCPYVFKVGSRSMIKRKEFDNYVSSHSKL